MGDQGGDDGGTITDEEYAARVLEQVLPELKCKVRPAKDHAKSHDIDLYGPGGEVEARVEVVRLTDPEAEAASARDPSLSPRGFFNPESNVSNQVQKMIDKKAEHDQAAKHEEPKWLVAVVSSPGGMDLMMTLGVRPSEQCKAEGDKTAHPT
ncbi:MAG: hypothetical protein F4028_10265 [Acidimicrobiaceae bacterium]|nr:hypothetical protein [Acidimicrobiaceae bacterium]MYG55419.1 hypothetical protein [Acidimicrobiaceae bacterium]MYJ99362.1 hypothetical protein [Acidimicrobiaceae bacterium]